MPSAPHMPVLPAVSLRVVEPDVIRADIHLPFGLKVERLVRVMAAPLHTSDLTADAMRAIVVLVAHKPLFVECPMESWSDTLEARVLVPGCKWVPEGCGYSVAGQPPLLDLGPALGVLFRSGYPAHLVRQIANGPQAH